MTKICIICPIHGEFWQTPLLHMKGKGCPKCSGHGKYSTEEIIERFRKIHGDRYSYDKFVFKTMKSKSIITCPKHGYFLQSASKHLIGRGCPECGKESMVQKNSLTSDIVLKRMKDIANENDDLSKVVYEKMDEKVEVICKKHGSYFIRPYDYLSGHRCPKCGLLVSHYEDELYDYICSLVGKENVVKNDRSILNGYEIDILLKSIELNPAVLALTDWNHAFKSLSAKLMLFKTPLKDEIKIKKVPNNNRTIVVLKTIFATGVSLSLLKIFGNVIAITGAIPPKIIKKDIVKSIIGSLL